MEEALVLLSVSISVSFSLVKSKRDLEQLCEILAPLRNKKTSHTCDLVTTLTGIYATKMLGIYHCKNVQ